MAVIDDFESGDLAGWTVHQGAASADGNVAYEGDYGIWLESNGEITWVTRLDGNEITPGQGDTIRAWAYMSSADFRLAAGYGVDSSNPGDNFYLPAFEPPNDRVIYWIRENGSWSTHDESPLDTSFTTDGVWVDFEMTWNNDDTHEFAVHSEDGSTTYGSVTMTDSRFAGNGGSVVWCPAHSGSTYGFDNLRVEVDTVPVTGVAELDDGTPLEGARVIGINDTEGIVEDVTLADANGDYTLEMTPGDTAHLVMEYDGAHGTHNAESKPFVVVQ